MEQASSLCFISINLVVLKIRYLGQSLYSKKSILLLNDERNILRFDKESPSPIYVKQC